MVGPVCETGDFLGKERELAIAPGDLLAVRSAGAYGFVMASNYNSRPRPAEVMVDGETLHLVRRREHIEELWSRRNAASRWPGGMLMLLHFTKMHGLGNDFMVVDLITQRARLRRRADSRLADRHFGIGFDQLLIVEPPADPDMDFRYRIFNADGSEVENCGNGARCFARFVRDQRLTHKHEIHVETRGGPLTLKVEDDGRVSVDMGVPRFAPQSLPFEADEDRLRHHLEVDGETLRSAWRPWAIPTRCSRSRTSTPHQSARLGPAIEAHPRFPRGSTPASCRWCRLTKSAFASSSAAAARPWPAAPAPARRWPAASARACSRVRSPCTCPAAS